MASESSESSQVTKGLLAFAAFVAVGFVIVATTKESPEEKLEASFLHSSNMLSKLALEKCGEAVYEHAKERVYTPTDSSSDRQTYVMLTWRSSGKVKEAECRYEKDKGITSLKLNGQLLVSRN